MKTTAISLLLLIALSLFLGCEALGIGDNDPPTDEVGDIRGQAKKGAIVLQWIPPAGEHDYIEITWTPVSSGSQPYKLNKGETNVLISNLTEGERHMFTVKSAKNNGTTSPGLTFTMNVSTQDAGTQSIQNLSPTDFNLRYVPAGTFQMGSMVIGGNADPEHKVVLTKNIWMGETEVTYALWTNVYHWATNNGYSFDNIAVMGDGSGDDENYPVTSMDWRDAVIWCNALSQKLGLTPVYTYSNQTLTNSVYSSETANQFNNMDFNYDGNGYRLATEAEWEFAARYIDSQSWTLGEAPSGWTDNNPANGSIDTAEFEAVAWIDSNSGGGTHEVAQKKANSLGLFDMSGNIDEWCWDTFHANYYQSGIAFIDPTGSELGSTKCVRSGSWELELKFSRCSERGGIGIGTKYSSMGLRIVRNDQ